MRHTSENNLESILSFSGHIYVTQIKTKIFHQKMILFSSVFFFSRSSYESILNKRQQNESMFHSFMHSCIEDSFDSFRGCD